MPVSRKYNTIFVHITKTGGTSVEEMLELDHDTETDPSVLREMLLNRMDGDNAYQHFVPRDMRRMISEAEWDKFYKFTIIRNPYSRAVSSFNFLNKFANMNIDTIEQFLHMAIQVEREGTYDTLPFYHHFRPQWHYFEDIEYDYVAHFENLQDDMKKICSTINCPNDLPVRNQYEYVKDYDWNAPENRSAMYLFEKVFGRDIHLHDISV